MTTPSGSHHEYSFTRTSSRYEPPGSNNLVDYGTGRCPCGWSATGSDDATFGAYAEHVREATATEPPGE